MYFTKYAEKITYKNKKKTKGNISIIQTKPVWGWNKGAALDSTFFLLLCYILCVCFLLLGDCFKLCQSQRTTFSTNGLGKKQEKKNLQWWRWIIRSKQLEGGFIGSEVGRAIQRESCDQRYETQYLWSINFSLFSPRARKNINLHYIVIITIKTWLQTHPVSGNHLQYR